MRLKTLVLLASFFMVCSCAKQEPLPCMGNPKTGEACYTVPDFNGSNQKSEVFTSQALVGKPYVVEFFYVSCPSVCPIVKSHLVKLYNDDNFQDLAFVSFSLAPVFDTPQVLDKYATDLGVNDGRWTFVNLPFKEVYQLANSYLIAAVPERTEDGEIQHDGRIVLVDGKGHIRATCKATEVDEVAKFKEQVQNFLAQQ